MVWWVFVLGVGECDDGVFLEDWGYGWVYISVCGVRVGLYDGFWVGVFGGCFEG